ncbi:2-dehydro-3-deoxygluconokinase [Chitinophaga niastensis]|uniref:2-dehydro-3-deoxygluconokinase n=2 Tax=Chitinophaga niastensis TaxID=536980 RepID=A0A2P8HF01_CHINA|nr:2-dehydro-3-deoxygluconokinase [Chitinophaga niastensis]
MQKPDGNKAIRLAAFGEFLLRLHSKGGKRFQQTDGYTAYYAGAEANVCVLLARLGMQVDYISCVPDNDLAAAGLQQLRSHGVGTDKMLYGGEKLGLYFTEAGNSIRPTRVIYDRVGTAYADLQRGTIDWKSVFQNTGYFHWSGVAAAISESAAAVCEEALLAALEAGVTISSDFNYRSKLWKYGQHPKDVMPLLLQHSEITVADLDAANVYYGIETDKKLPQEQRFEQCYTALQHKMPRLKTLGMSFRKVQGNQLWYTGALAHEGKFYFSAGFALSDVTDQIGTGDAFTAGMLYGLMNNYPPQTIIDFATACGTLKQSIPGDWAIISKNEVEELMANGVSGRIVR